MRHTKVSTPIHVNCWNEYMNVKLKNDNNLITTHDTIAVCKAIHLLLTVNVWHKMRKFLLKWKYFFFFVLVFQRRKNTFYTSQRIQQQSFFFPFFIVSPMCLIKQLSLHVHVFMYTSFFVFIHSFVLDSSSSSLAFQQSKLLVLH